MGTYKSLQKLYYENNSSEGNAAIKREAQRRFGEESTFRTGIRIKTGELFLAVPQQLSILSEKLLRVERKVSLLWHELPGIARGAYLRGLIIDEVVSTNEIESVYSTRRQIEAALESSEADKPSKEYRRFKEFAHLYLELTNRNHLYPKTSMDIRKIYDAVVAGELSENDLPDGNLFRKEEVAVVAPTQKAIHTGVMPESEIISMIEQMIALVASPSMPPTYSAIIAHFLFEYIHPFYDGNGRMGRYLLTLYLSEPLSLATILSLSPVIAENKSKYYKAFDQVESPINHAEITLFVIQIMEFIRIAQDAVIDDLEYKKALLQKAEVQLDAFHAKPYSLSKKECNVMFQAVQYYLFDIFSEISLENISRYFEVGTQTARKYTQKLEEKGLLKAVSLKPLKFTLTQEALTVFGIAVD